MKQKSEFLSKAQRKMVYRKVRQILLRPGNAIGFCKAFDIATDELPSIRKSEKNHSFYSRSATLAKTYPEIFARKPKTWYEHGDAYWFSPYNNNKAKSPRIRILNESIKELGG